MNRTELKQELANAKKKIEEQRKEIQSYKRKEENEKIDKLIKEFESLGFHFEMEVSRDFCGNIPTRKRETITFKR